MRVLEHFGFDPKTARGVHNKQVRMVNPCTFEDLVVENFSGVEDDYGAPFMFFHRVDLHTTLKEMALSTDERYPGSPAVIHNDVSVINLNCESGTIVLDDWETFEGDLIIVADGVRVSPVYRWYCRFNWLTLCQDQTHRQGYAKQHASRRPRLLFLPLPDPLLRSQ